MYSYRILYGVIVAGILSFFVIVSSCGTNESVTEKEAEPLILEPFAANNGIYPSPDEYDGPFFEGNYDYPEEVPTGIEYPWEKVLDGNPINLETADKYISSVHKYIYDDMAMMVNNPDEWTESENRQNWFNMAWSAQEYDTTGWDGKETIYGTLTGQVLKDSIFADYGYVGPIQNHALVYYNDVAAYTLYKLWKENDPSGFYPEYTTEAAQFEQNAVIIKAAGSTATGDDWDVLEGSGTFKIYRDIPFGPNAGKGPIVQELAWIQFDIIVKDTVAAPETGWVFSTYIYDASSNGATTFDRMELLGVAWGNDPDLLEPGDELQETWLNPNRPDYAAANIGYGDRLSGPIDVALVGGLDYKGNQNDVYVLNKDGSAIGGKSYSHFRASACMSCHGTAAWPWQNDFYPSPVQELVYSDTLYNPASEGWSNYYQNRPGDEIMPTLDGTTRSRMALDYDLFMMFALNNSLLGSHFKPMNKPEKPEGYTLLNLEEYPIHYKPESK